LSKILASAHGAAVDVLLVPNRVFAPSVTSVTPRHIARHEIGRPEDDGWR